MQFYGFLSNSRTAALVGPDASVDWLAFPRFDGASVFTRLLGDERHGYFRIQSAGARVTRQRYLPGTNVLETELQAAEGKAVICDYLTMGRAELRRVVLTEIPLTVELKPVFEYGLIAADPFPLTEAAVAFENPRGPEMLVFVPVGHTKDPNASITGDPLTGVWILPPGRYDLILRYLADTGREAKEAQESLMAEASSAEQALRQEEPHDSLRHTIRYWKDHLVTTYGGPYREAVERALLVLYGLQYRTNGAIIAAPTTSLPETVGETRQWDYRFSWIRDGAYMAEALLDSGDHVSARRFIEFMLSLVDLQGKPFKAPFFHIDGTLIRGEHDLGWLPGFRDSRPVREGNAATSQTQLDVEGDFLWTVHRYVTSTRDREFLHFYWTAIETMVDWVAEHWEEKDASLWEFRGQDDHYTHSKLMCWVALHYGAELAHLAERPARTEKWRKAAGEVRNAIEEHGFSRQQNAYVQAFGTDNLDAAVLTLPLYGYCPANSARFKSTVAAIERDLLHFPWVYRYGNDMLGKAAHPFVLATSWLARVYIRQGEYDRAERLLEALLMRTTDLGLLGEHADVETGEPRGNFPQGFSHLGVLMTVLELEAARAGAKTKAAESAS